MKYRSISDLNRDIIHWLPRLPRDYDLVLGIPRSGLLAASILTLHLNLPLATPESFLRKNLLGGGVREKRGQDPNFWKRELKVLVVDDSLSTGSQMREIRKALADSETTHEIDYSVVYVSPGGKSLVDSYAVELDTPRVFEWNLMHTPLGKDFCFDIDGVLCPDPTEDENDDGPKYESFLLNVPPLVTPTNEVGWIVTSRLKKYQPLTEEWLGRNGIKYNHLEMLDLPTKEARISARCHASFKAEIYGSCGARLFIESSLAQAREIALRTGKPVVCFETGELVSPTKTYSEFRRGARFFKKAARDPRHILRTIRDRMTIAR